MADTTDSTLAGAGTGAISGAGTGASVGGIPGAIIGGVVGGVAGGVSGNFQGRAAARRRDAEDAARRKLQEAQTQYATDSARNDAQYQAQVAETLKQQQQMGMDRFTKTPTGQDYANTLQTSTKQAQGQPMAPTGGPSTAYTRAAQGESQSRYAAALAPAAHEAALAHVQQLSAATAQQYGLKSSELNAQLAHIANNHGIERAQIAARYAAATGQYPLDMQLAEQAGAHDAATAGYIQMGTGITSGILSSVAAAKRNEEERNRNNAMMDKINLMRQGEGGSSTGETSPSASNLS